MGPAQHSNTACLYSLQSPLLLSSRLRMRAVIGIYYLEEHEIGSKMPGSIKILWRALSSADLILLQCMEISGFEAPLINL